MSLPPESLDQIALVAKIVGASLVVALFIFSWRFVVGRDARERRRVTDHLAKNPALEPAEFAVRYFPADQAEVARRLRELLVPHLQIDLSRLHPDDRLVKDLRMDDLDSMATVEFVLSVEKEFGIKLPEAEVAHILTLRELTAAVSRLVAERIPPQPRPRP